MTNADQPIPDADRINAYADAIGDVWNLDGDHLTGDITRAERDGR